jgi:hypothetical protein
VAVEAGSDEDEDEVWLPCQKGPGDTELPPTFAAWEEQAAALLLSLGLSSGTPSAGLLMIFDVVELFAGTAGISHACAALNLIVLPIELMLGWDLTHLTLFRWICHLAT